MSLVRLAGLPAPRYEHEFDRRALDSLKGTHGLDLVVRKCSEWGLERVLRIQLTGSHLRVTADNFPHLHDLVGHACEVLDVQKRPDVYVGGMEGLNAMTAGVERPVIVLSAAAVDMLDDEELAFVVGHELGHIKSEHVFYRQIAKFFPMLAGIAEASSAGLAKLFTLAMEVALRTWERASEFTADRAGLLATQNPDAAFRTLMKLAGLPEKYARKGINTDDFIAQAREFQALDEDAMNWLLKGISVLDRSHPWTVMRAHELLGSIDAGEYGAILETGRRLAAAPRPSSCCAACGASPKAGAAFCSRCGGALSEVPRDFAR